jgi:hypothetical protein
MSSESLPVGSKIAGGGFQKEYTEQQVKQHNKDDDCWIIVNIYTEIYTNIYIYNSF